MNYYSQMQISMIRILLLVLVFGPHQMVFGQKFDQIWLTGYLEFVGLPGYGHAQIVFDDSAVIVEQTTLAFNFESTVATMSDENGELLFYTNGCAVANRINTVMPNGTGLNPGEINDKVCPWKGYIVPQGAMVLPDPGDTSRYYLFHMGASYDPVRKLKLGPLYFTQIDMSLQNGLGDVVSKNNVLLDGDLGSFTAIRDGNGRDWWLLVPEFGNLQWHVYRLSTGGVVTLPAQSISFLQPSCEKFMATAASPVGDRIAVWGDCKVSVLDFDRCSGALSHPIEMGTPTHWIPGGGAAFSRSGRYLYATSQNVLFRADLDDPTPKMDTMRFSYDPYSKSPYDVPGNTFHMLANGPDGNIYGNIPSRARFLHVLRHTDGASIQELDFKAKGLPLPVIGVRTLPSLPNYRLYDLPDSPCDTLGISPTTETWAGAPPQVRPNPASEVLHIDFPQPNEVVYVALHNSIGQTVFENKSRVDAIPVGHLPPGVYVLDCRQRNGGVYRVKVAVVD